MGGRLIDSTARALAGRFFDEFRTRVESAGAAEAAAGNATIIPLNAGPPAADPVPSQLGLKLWAWGLAAAAVVLIALVATFS
jgi:hypothetical protein